MKGTATPLEGYYLSNCVLSEPYDYLRSPLTVYAVSLAGLAACYSLLHVIRDTVPDVPHLLGTITAETARFKDVKRLKKLIATDAIDSTFRATIKSADFIQLSSAKARRQVFHSFQQRSLWAQTYQYAPLIENDEIRLVMIYLAQRNTKLVCTLVHEYLHNCLSNDGPSTPSHQYEALSYTWGDLTALQPVRCYHESKKGSQRRSESRYEWLYITANCASALRRLRLKDRPRRIWIDAICIDQRNIEEINSQVRMIARIYRTASRVVVCLCDASEHTLRALTTIFQLYKDAALTTAEMLQFDRVEAIQYLLNQPWFSRIWVLQEVYMAKSNLALLGQGSFEWNTLGAVVKKSKALLWNLIQIEFPFSLMIHDDDICAKTLFDLLCGTRHCAATDPRDKYSTLCRLRPEVT
jgi:hypothetical protein